MITGIKRSIAVALLVIGLTSWETVPGWLTNFEKAKEMARQKHQLILLNFSGSDWCGPCIRLRKEVFESASFKAIADSSLVLVNADFPRSKKNQLEKELKKHNEQLADKYNSEGKFPFTVLMDAEGKVIKSWEGFPATSASEFCEDINALVHASR